MKSWKYLYYYDYLKYNKFYFISYYVIKGTLKIDTFYSRHFKLLMSNTIPILHRYVLLISILFD